MASRPSAIPARGWRDVALRVKREIKQDDVPLLAAGVAFFALLALVPALVALVSVYGLVADPADIQRNVEDVLAAAPTEVRDLVQSQLSSIVDSSPQGLRLGALAGLVVALWSASSGMKHLIAAVNRAYDEDETRGFVRLRGLSLILTIGAVAGLLVALYALVVAPNSISDEGSMGLLRTTLLVVRWPLLAIAAMVGLAVIYRYAPDRAEPRWNWVSIGAVFATLVWLAASVGFSIYSANFGRYNETYGALGAVVVMMLWLYISAYAAVAGAELNAEMERQTVRDTTTGRPEAMGRREAYAADTLGESPGR
jgi:membrane protein